MFLEQKIAKNRKEYFCNNCDYYTCNLYDYTKHMSTRKHEKQAISNKIEQNRTEKSQQQSPMIKTVY